MGKTKLSHLLFRGIGHRWESLDFKKHSIDRGAHSAYSLLRFYDEAPVSRHSGKDIYSNFVDLEAPTSRLYKANLENRACQFVFVANAAVKGLPNFGDFRLIKGSEVADGEHGEREYHAWKGMAERRFMFLRLDGVESFLGPYTRMMEDSRCQYHERVAKYAGEMSGLTE